MQKAVFFDKDGTLIDDLPYNINPSLLTWKEGCFDALRKLEQAGYLLVIITNQSGIARGLFEEKDMETLIAYMIQTLKENGITLAGFYYSPYHIEGNIKQYAIESEDRKPRPGMLIKAAKELDINLMDSWMAGDILNDVEAGNRAGCKTILINGTGNQTLPATDIYRIPLLIVNDIQKAADQILRYDTRLNND